MSSNAAPQNRLGGLGARIRVHAPTDRSLEAGSRVDGPQIEIAFQNHIEELLRQTSDALHRIIRVIDHLG